MIKLRLTDLLAVVLLLLPLSLFSAMTEMAYGKQDISKEQPKTTIQTGTSITINDLNVRLKPAKYDSIRRSGGLQGSITGWLAVVVVTNNTAEWKSLVIPVSELQVVTQDGKTYHLAENSALGLSNGLLELQNVNSAKWGLINKKSNGGNVSSGDGIFLFFSPPGKNPNSDPHTAKLFDTMGTWKLELAPNESFLLPLVFDCPNESKPIEMSWPNIANFKLQPTL